MSGMKYKVGDKVRQSATWKEDPKEFEGVIVKANPRFKDYRVHIGGEQGVWLFMESELEAA